MEGVAAPRPCSQWPRWCVQQTRTRPQDRPRSQRLCASSARLRASALSALSSKPSSGLRTRAGKPCVSPGAWQRHNLTQPLQHACRSLACQAASPLPAMTFRELVSVR
jgi:hypothetical protein